MAIKKYKPTTPGRRGMTVTDYSVLSKVEPERSLLEPMKKSAGRNNLGRITVRPFPVFSGDGCRFGNPLALPRCRTL